MAAVRGRSRSQMGQLFGPLIAGGGTHNDNPMPARTAVGGFTRNVGRLLTRMLLLFAGA